MTLEWQSPTEWSVETKDGVWYAESVANGMGWRLYQRIGANRQSDCGKFDSAEAARAHAEAIANAANVAVLGRKVAPDPDDEPHWSGNCVCLGCRHEWVGVGPIGTVLGLDCPACQLPKGAVKHPFGAQVGDAVLICANCGGEALTAYRRAGDGLKVFKCMACGSDLTDALFDG